ncbi:hypothetical protein TNCV_3756721 [Trichonephila clavipes]|nr:hypothetical protein TNCV_3756721 [Trichonephila clavipes]
MAVDDSLPWKILWTDEAHFHLNRQANSDNCRFWGTENPHEQRVCLQETILMHDGASPYNASSVQQLLDRH